jgi:class 3 adenylate cyclase
MSVAVGGDHPASRVTYLLTDIEGSTRRWEADPDHMAQLLEAHDMTIEAEVTRAGGELIKARGEGDSTFAVFPAPPAALAAALACQMRLLSDVGLPVRMAVHTADTNRRWGEYYGPPVNRAARLRSLAAGGRVLLSATTAEAVRPSLPPACDLVDLGVFVLKDLERPERVFGLRHPALPEVIMPRDSALGCDLVGRTDEVTRLRALLADVERALPRIAVVIGDGGMGKTRLAEVIGREACAAGGRLLWSTARSDQGAPPFSIWTDLLKRLTDPGGDRARDEPEEVSAGLPLLGDGPGRDHLYDRVVAVLRGAAQSHLILVVFDDLHLADPSSLQFLRRVGVERDLGRVMFLVMSRPTPPEHPARQVLSQLSHAPNATRIDLGELPPDECARVLASCAPELDASAAREVVRHAGGNPLFLRAYAGTMIRSTGRAVVPDSVRVAIAERLLSVDPTAVRVLQVAAVAARSIAVDVTADAAGVDESLVLAALGAGETAGIVSQASVTVPTWRFTHDLIRDAVIAEIDPAERAATHGRIGRAIERLRAGSLHTFAAEIANHLSRAPADQWRDAVGHGETATRAALRVGAFEEAAGHCQRALDLLAEVGGTPLHRARLLLLLGRALHADDVEAAGNAILEAIGLARSAGDADLLIKAIEALPHDMDRLDARAVAELQTVLAQLGDCEPEVAARLRGHLAFHHYTARHWDELRREADAAWELSRDLTDPATRYLGSIGRLLTLWCDPDRATSQHVLDECTRSAETCPDPSVTLRGRFMRMRPLIERADRDGFNTTLELLEGGVGGNVATYSQWVATTWRVLEATLDGDLQGADDLLEPSARLSRAVARQISLAVQFHQQTMLRFEQGRLPEQTEALDSFESVWPGHPVVLGWQGITATLTGDERRARAILATVDDDGFENIPAQLIFAFAPLTETAVALGDVAASQRLATVLAPRLGHLLVGFGIASACYGAVDRYLGLICAQAGDYGAALAHHAAAARLHRRFRSRLWRLHSQLDTAAALIGRDQPGDRAQAQSLVEDVTDEAAPTAMRRVQLRAADLRGQLQ